MVYHLNYLDFGYRCTNTAAVFIILVVIVLVLCVSRVIHYITTEYCSVENVSRRDAFLFQPYTPRCIAQTLKGGGGDPWQL